MSAVQQPKKPDSIGKAALLFGSGTLTSRILGLIRDAMIFSFMPLDMKDAWLAAFRLPNFFRRLLGEGGLSVSFIPIYVGLLGEKHSSQRRALIDGVFTLLMSLVTLICVLCFVFMEPIVELWLGGPGFTDVPGKIEMTIHISRIMVFFLFFITLFAYFMALLNGLRKFTLSGYAPMALNVAIIAGLYFYRDHPNLVGASAWSVLVGGLLQALILLPGVRRERVMPRLSSAFRHPIVMRVLRKFLPTVFGVGVLQIMALINGHFASHLRPGALSYIYLGDRLLELPLSLIAVSIGTTMLPSLSGYWTSSDKTHFSNCLGQHIRLFFFLALPSAFGLWVIGFDIVDVLFARGEFTGEEVPVVANILKIFCLTLLAAGSLKLFNQAFYATGDTLTPAIIAALGLVVHVIIAPLLMAEMGIYGLVLSTALVSFLNLIVCALLLQKKVGFLNLTRIFGHFLLCIIASSIMGVFLYGSTQVQWKQGRFIYDFPILMLIIALGGGLFFMASAILKIEEMSILKRKLTRRR